MSQARSPHLTVVVQLMAVIITLGCSHKHAHISMSDIEMRIPVGSSPNQVIQSMEHAGYKCRIARNEDCKIQVDSSDGEKEYKILPGKDFVSCTLTSQENFVTSIHSFRFLLNEESRVSEIYECWDYIGF